jgi:RNA polymerase sigma factor (sigma-70 family)
MLPHGATRPSIMVRIQDPNDQEAWNEFHELYGPMICGWLKRQGVRDHDAEDIKQEVMQIAMVQLRGFDHSGRTGALRCWLRTTVQHQLQRFWRKRAKQPQGWGGCDADDLAKKLADPSSELSRLFDKEYEQSVLRFVLAKAEAEFEEKTMEAFRRTFFSKKSAKEVGAELGMTPNAVRIAKSHVLQCIREIGEGMLV